MTPAPTHAGSRLAAAKSVALAAAQVAASTRKMYADAASGPRVSVRVEIDGVAHTVSVPYAVTEQICAALEADSRACEAVVYAAAGLEDEALISAAAVYSVMLRLRPAIEADDAVEHALSADAREVLSPYLLAAMADESGHVQHLMNVGGQPRVAKPRALLHSRYADAAIRMAAAQRLREQILITANEGDVDSAFLAQSAALSP